MIIIKYIMAKLRYETLLVVGFVWGVVASQHANVHCWLSDVSQTVVQWISYVCQRDANCLDDLWYNDPCTEMTPT